MSDWEIDGREVSSDSLWRVIEDFESGALSPEAEEELFQILEESHRARQIYLAYFELTALLQIKAETQKEEGTLPVLPNHGKHRRTLGLSAVAAAAVILLLGVLAALVKLHEAEPRSLALEVAAGSAWTVSGGRDSGDDAEGVTLVEGSTLVVTSGTVGLTSESGVRMIVQGPASVGFPSFETPVVERGWLWVDSGAGGTKLRIDTPRAELRNLGTRFGVRVRSDDRWELHLIEGIVEATAKSGGSRIRFEPNEEGVLFPPEGTGEAVTLAVDPFPVADKILEAPGSYATTVLGQSPTGYWRLEGNDGREALNQVPGSSIGLYSTGVQPASPGVRPADGLHGFEPENRGVFMSGARDDSVVYHLDGRGGVSPQEGAVAFWFRREPGIERPEVLWFAGVPGGGGLGPFDEMQAFLSEDGRVQFFMEDGRYDVLLSSPRGTVDGTWHHVVATWSLDEVVLYLDGRLVARDHEYRKAEGPNFTGMNVRLGKTGSGTNEAGGRKLMPLKGWLDELALWGRALTPAEIRLQYRSAVGDLPDGGADPDQR